MFTCKVYNVRYSSTSYTTSFSHLEQFHTRGRAVQFADDKEAASLDQLNRPTRIVAIIDERRAA